MYSVLPFHDIFINETQNFTDTFSIKVFQTNRNYYFQICLSSFKLNEQEHIRSWWILRFCNTDKLISHPNMNIFVLAFLLTMKISYCVMVIFEDSMSVSCVVKDIIYTMPWKEKRHCMMKKMQFSIFKSHDCP